MVFGKHTIEGYREQGLSLKDAFHRNSPPIGYEGMYNEWIKEQAQWRKKRDELLASVQVAIAEINNIKATEQPTKTESVTYHDAKIIDLELGSIARALLNIDTSEGDTAFVVGQQVGNDVTANFTGVKRQESAKLIEAESRLSQAVAALRKYEDNEPKWLDQIPNKK